MHKLWDIYLSRCEKFLSPSHYPDANIHNHVYRARDSTAVSLEAWSVPFNAHGPPPPLFREAMTQASFLPTLVGAEFGPSWSTHWFRVTIALPKGWEDQSPIFRWSSGSEALVFSCDGHVLQGLSDQDRNGFELTSETLTNRHTHQFYIVHCRRALISRGC